MLRIPPRDRRGFTLLELIVVILIVAVLAAIGVVAYTGLTDRAHTTAAQANLRQVTTAVIAAATERGADVITRDLVLEVMATSSNGQVTDGLEAAAWALGRAGDSPSQPGEFAVGFDQGGVDASDSAGTRAAIVVATGDGSLLAQVFTAAGAGPVVPAQAGVTPEVVLNSAPAGGTIPTLSEGGAITAPESAPAPAGLKLLAPDGAAMHYFGYAVAMSGDTLVVGARGDAEKGSYAGAVYVYTRTGDTWTLQDKVFADDAKVNMSFGYAVAVDGDTLVVGAYKDSATAYNSGSAYVFTRTGGTWAQQAKLVADDGASSDEFGSAVAIDGDTVVVAAEQDDDAGLNAGAVYVFTRTGGTWTQQAKLIGADVAANDHFGHAVAVGRDTVVIGSYGDDDHGASGSGSAYVFTRTGGTWTQQAKLTASDPAANANFGIKVALDGNTLAVSASSAPDVGGAVYVFTRTGGTWTQQAKVTTSDGQPGDWFGSDVALDGDTLVGGAYGDDDNGSDAGAVYVFTRTGGSWTERAKILAPDGAATDWFGSAVAVDGGTLAVGAYNDNDLGYYGGAVWVLPTP